MQDVCHVNACYDRAIDSDSTLQHIRLSTSRSSSTLSGDRESMQILIYASLTQSQARLCASFQNTVRSSPPGLFTPAVRKSSSCNKLPC
jgi:hypothetical protein